MVRLGGSDSLITISSIVSVASRALSSANLERPIHFLDWISFRTSLLNIAVHGSMIAIDSSWPKDVKGDRSIQSYFLDINCNVQFYSSWCDLGGGILVSSPVEFCCMIGCKSRKASDLTASGIRLACQIWSLI